MPAPVFNGIGDAIFSAFQEAEKAVFTAQVDPDDPSPPAPVPVEIDVIFNSRWRETDNQGLPYGSPNPMAWMKQEDADQLDPIFGDSLTVGGGDYKIVGVEPDGHEIVRLILQATA